MHILEILNFSHIETGVAFIAFFAIVAFVFRSRKASNCPCKAKVSNIGADEFSHRLSKVKKNRNNILIDIRTREEFLAGHIEGATNIDVYSSDFKQRLAILDRKKEYFIYCQSGSRTFWAVRAMKKLCFENILVLKRGFIAWQQEFGISKKNNKHRR